MVELEVLKEAFHVKESYRKYEVMVQRKVLELESIQCYS